MQGEAAGGPASRNASDRRGAAARSSRRPGASREARRDVRAADVPHVYLHRRRTLTQQLLQTLSLLAIFLPFSYFMDSFMYRATRGATGQVLRPPVPR